MGSVSISASGTGKTSQTCKTSGYQSLIPSNEESGANSQVLACFCAIDKIMSLHISQKIHAHLSGVENNV